MPDTDAYLFFNGNCAEAMRSYEKILAGKLELIPVGDTPPGDFPPNVSRDSIMHARLVFDGGSLMASDWMDKSAYPGMGGFAISLVYKGVDEAKKIFDAISKGGKVTMPMGETFWAETFGMTTDLFGTPWMVTGGSKPM